MSMKDDLQAWKGRQTLWRFRDQRSYADKRAAYAFIAKNAQVCVTDKTQQDLAILGLTISNRVRIKPEDADCVVAGFYDLEIGLIFRDNFLGKCPDCLRPIQWRPHSEPGKVKLCLFCTADRLAAKMREEGKIWPTSEKR